MCPHCQNPRARLRKKGFYIKRSTRQNRIQRFRCLSCLRSFSDQTRRLSYRQKKPHIDQPIYRMLNSGISQRRTAFLLGVRRQTVANKLMRLGAAAASDQATWRAQQELPDGQVAVFDEMETFEHSKCKPLAIAVAVQEKTRFIVAAEVSQMPAKGPLAAISRRKYGWRRDDRKKGLQRALGQVATAFKSLSTVKSDECPRYPKVVREVLPGVTHQTFKGRRGCVVGQGELKAGGFDPLFSLNHSCAMIRDNIKRLSRRTWCTTKDPASLQDLLNIYVAFHNGRLLEPRRRPILGSDPIT